MKKVIFVTVLFFLVLLLGSSPVLEAHCQVPCGIYDDEARVKAIAEHITTMEKAMKEVEALSVKKLVNYNQVVRWVMNKEKHAEQLSDIVTYYFLAQRVKPVSQADGAGYPVYRDKLEVLHQMLVYAMKAKQTTDQAHIKKLRELLKRFEELYFGKHK